MSERLKRIWLRALIVVVALTLLGAVVNSIWPATCGIQYGYVSLATGKVMMIDQGLFLWAQRVDYGESRLSRMLEKYHTECECDKGRQGAEWPGYVLTSRREIGLLQYTGFSLPLHRPGGSSGQGRAFSKANLIAKVLEMRIEDGLVTEAEAKSVLCETLLNFRLARAHELDRLAEELVDRLEEGAKANDGANTNSSPDGDVQVKGGHGGEVMRE